MDSEWDVTAGTGPEDGRGPQGADSAAAPRPPVRPPSPRRGGWWPLFLKAIHCPSLGPRGRGLPPPCMSPGSQASERGLSSTQDSRNTFRGTSGLTPQPTERCHPRGVGCSGGSVTAGLTRPELRLPHVRATGDAGTAAPGDPPLEREPEPPQRPPLLSDWPAPAAIRRPWLRFSPNQETREMPWAHFLF